MDIFAGFIPPPFFLDAQEPFSLPKEKGCC